MKNAFDEFTKHQNMRTFIYDILNGNKTTFIECLSEINEKEPDVNARELSTLVGNYLNDVYRLSAYFDEKNKVCFADYIHKNENAASLAFEYLIATLNNTLSKDEMVVLYGVVLEPYQTENRLYGEKN